jgi:hypothetical protein
LFKKIITLFYQLAGLDQFDTSVSSLSNIRPISNSEKRAARIIKMYPHLKESDLIEDAEQGWVRVMR